MLIIRNTAHAKIKDKYHSIVNYDKLLRVVNCVIMAFQEYSYDDQFSEEYFTSL